MKKNRSFLLMSMASLSFMSGPAFGAHAHAHQKDNASTINAPIMKHIPAAAKDTEKCGVFQTCTNTRIGTGKGDVMIRLSALGVFPEDRDSRAWVHVNSISNGNGMNSIVNGHHTTGGLPINGPTAFLGGHQNTTDAANPEMTFEVFLTDNLSMDVITASTHHEVDWMGAHLPKSINGQPFGIGRGHAGAPNNLPVGTAYVLPPTVTYAYHFRPHKRFNPYAGAGVTAIWFTNMSTGRSPLTGALGRTTKGLNSGFTGGPSFNLGFDYQIVGNWFFNMDVKEIFVRMHSWENFGYLAGRNKHHLGPSPLFLGNHAVGGRIKAHESLDPTVASAGIAYRF